MLTKFTVNHFSPNRFRIMVLGVLALALCLRLAAAAYWQKSLAEEGKTVRFGDSDSYWVLAEKISRGAEYEYAGENSKIFRAPLYPMVLAPVAYLGSMESLQEYKTWLPHFLGRLIGIIAGMFAIGLIMRMAYEFSGQLSSLMAGLFASTYPGAIGMSIFLLSEAIFVPLMMLCLYGSWRVLSIVNYRATGIGKMNSAELDSRARDIRETSRLPYLSWVHQVVFWSLIVGAAYGMGCLARPSWSLWGPALAVFFASVALLTRLRASWRILLLHLAVIATTSILVMLPWWVRNYRVTGKFVPTTLQVGPSLYDGLHPGATGSSDEGMAFVERFWAEQTTLDNAALQAGLELESTYEWRLNQIMQNAAIAWVKENPAEALRLGGVKLYKTWRPLPVAQELGNPLIRYGEGISYSILMLAGGLGLWKNRYNPSLWLIALPIIYFSLIHMVFIGSVRYRQPAVLAFSVVAGIGLGTLFSLREKRLRDS